jgi:hypothetical protein
MTLPLTPAVKATMKKRPPCPLGRRCGQVSMSMASTRFRRYIHGIGARGSSASTLPRARRGTILAWCLKFGANTRWNLKYSARTASGINGLDVFGWAEEFTGRREVAKPTIPLEFQYA